MIAVDFSAKAWLDLSDARLTASPSAIAACATVLMVFGANSTALAQEVLIPAASTNDFSIIGLSASLALDETVELNAATLSLIGDLEGSVLSAGGRYRLTDSVGVGTSYFGVFEASTFGRANPRDHRIRIDVDGRVDLGFILLSHRSRLEYRFRDIDDQTRYRPQLRATLNTHLPIRPFFSVEPFFVLDDFDTQLVLLEPGIRASATSQVALVVSYIRGVVLGGAEQNIIVAQLALSL
ncbi:MAG: DUF2490 domain-containing protein [Myxococcota bacterium]